MRIVYCGTPDFAVPPLLALCGLAPRHEVVGVVSQPDKPQGRSHQPMPPPVVVAAREAGLPAERIFQPRSINRASALDALRALSPDLFCVVAYGNLLREAALSLPRLFPINAHASLLPRHRGAAPIQAALLAGDTETGVCVMKMEAALDAGPVLLERRTPIAANDDAGTLHDRLAKIAADSLVEAVECIAAGAVVFTPQDESRATYAAKLTKESGLVDWSRDAAYLERFVRAMNPWPGAWTRISAGSASLRVRIARATLISVASAGNPGSGRTLEAGAQTSIAVECGTGALAITHLQPEGKRAVSVAEFLRGAGRAYVSASRWS